jgi:glycosyltransferase involved in cell wall biosynthesis
LPSETHPEVTVVIPTRDRWPLLMRALKSALQQEQTELEVIVVDDGSAPKIPAEAIEAEDSRVRVVRHDTPQGPALARNTGIAAARGRWLAFLDDDDVWAPRMIRTQLDVARREGASFVYCAMAVIDELGNVLGVSSVPDPGRLRVSLLQQNVVGGGSNVIVEADLVRRLGGFDGRLPALEDWDLWIRLAFAAKSAACEATLVAILIHEGNSVAQGRNVFKSFRLLALKHRAASDFHGVRFDHVAFARWVADGHHHAGQRWRVAGTYLWALFASRSGHDIGRVLNIAAKSQLDKRRGHDAVQTAATVDLGWLDLRP